ncbi:MAG: hypothetical protein AAF928_14360 [Myxococcota bacterium]
MLKQVQFVGGVVLAGAVLVGCGDDDSSSGGPAPSNVWNGPTIEFSKFEDADPTDPENQDRITDNVIITRSLVGGPIYNAAVDNEPTAEELMTDKDWSAINGPSGTEWAIGDLNDALTLDYDNLRATLGNGQGAFQSIVGESLVVHLLDDDVYVGVTFSEWGMGAAGKGVFVYERTTQP